MTVRKRRPPAEGEVEVFGVDEQTDEPVELARWVDLATNVLADAGIRGEAELSLVFVGEEVMADLNKRFMDADGPTDVLAFPLEDDADGLPGEIQFFRFQVEFDLDAGAQGVSANTVPSRTCSAPSATRPRPSAPRSRSSRPTAPHPLDEGPS